MSQAVANTESRRHPHFFLTPAGAFAGALLAAVGAGLVGRALGWSDSAIFGAVLGCGLVALMPALLRMAAQAERRPRMRPVEEWQSKIAMSPARDSKSLHPKTVVPLIGFSGSGKSVITEAFEVTHPSGVAVASCGAVVKAKAKERGIPWVKEQTDRFGDELVSELGGDGFLDLVLAHVRGPDDARLLVIDDVYHPEVFHALIRRLEHTRPVLVTNPPYLTQDPGADSPLDVAAEKLIATITPEFEIKGVAGGDQDQAVESANELSSRLGADPALSTT